VRGIGVDVCLCAFLGNRVNDEFVGVVEIVDALFDVDCLERGYDDWEDVSKLVSSES